MTTARKDKKVINSPSNGLPKLHFLYISYIFGKHIFSNSQTIQPKFHEVAQYSYCFIQQNEIATTFLLFKSFPLTPVLLQVATWVCIKS